RRAVAALPAVGHALPGARLAGRAAHVARGARRGRRARSAAHAPVGPAHATAFAPAGRRPLHAALDEGVRVGDVVVVDPAPELGGHVRAPVALVEVAGD